LEHGICPCGTQGPDRPRRNMELIARNGPGNRLLAGLPSADFDLISPHLVKASFPRGAVLAETGNDTDLIYFPLDGMITLLSVTQDGKAIETATIGRDGVFGAMAVFGPYRSRVRAIVQVPMTAVHISAPQLRAAADASKAISLLCIHYNETLLGQARMTAACNALHPIEERLCRWLLRTCEVIETNTIHLTQEFLSEMLGVRRSSITEAAIRLQAAGLISYSRGVINVLDISGIQQRACGCFQTLRDQRDL
jgi:CRP-like cAMP-binding protein